MDSSLSDILCGLDAIPIVNQWFSWSSYFFPRCQDGNTCDACIPSCSYCKYTAAAACGNCEDLQKYRNCRDQKAFLGRTSLHLAAQNGHGEAVKLLLKLGVYVDARDQYGNTPFMMAILSHRLGMARILLDAKADINGANCQGRTPLHEIALHNWLLSASRLLDWSKEDRFLWTNAIDHNGRTPVDEAIYLCNYGLAEMLVQHGALTGTYARVRLLEKWYGDRAFDTVWSASPLRVIIERRYADQSNPSLTDAKRCEIDGRYIGLLEQLIVKRSVVHDLDQLSIQELLDVLVAESKQLVSFARSCSIDVSDPFPPRLKNIFRGLIREVRVDEEATEQLIADSADVRSPEYVEVNQASAFSW